MTTSTTSLDELIQKCQTLPPGLQQQVIDFVEFLIGKYSTHQEITNQTSLGTEAKSERMLGMHRGKIWISDDFDAPLPDQFWLGEE
jgi:hypothetical protein